MKVNVRGRLRAGRLTRSLSSVGAGVLMVWFVLPASGPREGLEARSAEGRAGSEPGLARAPAGLGEPVSAARSQGPGAGPWLAALAGAVNEAALNCEILGDAPIAASLRRLDVARSLAAVFENPLVHRVSYGELPQLAHALRLLKAFAASGVEGAEQLEELLAEHSLSVDDVRFLGGFVHWYLEGAFSLAVQRGGGRGEAIRSLKVARHDRHPRLYDPAKLARFAGKDFETLLGEMD
jgi:hypothetical protein